MKREILCTMCWQVLWPNLNANLNIIYSVVLDYLYQDREKWLFWTQLNCLLWNQNLLYAMGGYEETVSVTVLHFTPPQRNAVSMTSWKRPQNPMTSVSELLTRALAFTGRLPFQIPHCIVFVSMGVLIRLTVLMFDSENVVTVITRVSSSQSEEMRINS